MVGAGYVGLVSGACLASLGHRVIVVDRDPRRITDLIAGIMPIHEPGLDSLVAAEVTAGRLAFTTDLASAVPGADAVFICVGTPRVPRTAMPTCAMSWRRRRKPGAPSPASPPSS